ncbi:hypothetical protein [Sulfobacillus harzensis]|uniref:Uncharacterized protein n=1 Tax=Sulfobacillus harzensis TaxID=2729629 RepID=A0A7Y0L836_9FIRM|nr:hypothetical protein [Sulfobacillus harzensis]NMP24506.1 hypothetical protein [Sulfobacillus harzensis]
MTTIRPESLAEGLALIAEGLDHVEAAPDPVERQSIVSAVRGILQTLAGEVGHPDALTWPHDPGWVSPFSARDL